MTRWSEGSAIFISDIAESCLGYVLQKDMNNSTFKGLFQKGFFCFYNKIHMAASLSDISSKQICHWSSSTEKLLCAFVHMEQMVIWGVSDGFWLWVKIHILEPYSLPWNKGSWGTDNCSYQDGETCLKPSIKMLITHTKEMTISYTLWLPSSVFVCTCCWGGNNK